MPRTVKYNRARNAPSQTLLEYLAGSFTYLTESEWTWHIREGHVSVNNTTEYDTHRVLLQRDEITFAPPRSMEPEVDDVHITIIYVDDFLIVCSKNGNLPVSEGGRYCENTLVGVLMREGLRKFYSVTTVDKSTSSCENIEEMVRKKRAIEVEQDDQHCGSGCKTVDLDVVNFTENDNNSSVCEKGHTSNKNETSYSELKLFVVHRLDKETSGLVIIARNAHIARLLSLQFSEPTAEHNSTCVEDKFVECKPEKMLMSANECNSEHHNETKTSIMESSNNANVQSENDKRTNSNKRTIIKKYIAVLVGCAEVKHTYEVNAPIGCMANNITMRSKAEHQKLKKLKMMCYNSENFNEEAVECLISNCKREDHKELSDDQEKNADNGFKKEQKAKSGKFAKSLIYILANDTELNLSVAQITIYTGRTHQIRLHCAEIGFPIFGDKLYYSRTLGKEGNSCAVDDDLYLARVRATQLESYMTDKHVANIKVRRHLLHAAYISFTHPVHDEVIEIIDNPLESFRHDVLIEHKWVEERFAKLLQSTISTNTV